MKIGSFRCERIPEGILELVTDVLTEKRLNLGSLWKYGQSLRNKKKKKEKARILNLFLDKTKQKLFPGLRSIHLEAVC